MYDEGLEWHLIALGAKLDDRHARNF